MGYVLVVSAVAYFFYGMARPQAVLPHAVGKPSRWKVVGIAWALSLLGGALQPNGDEALSGDEASGDEAPTVATVQVAGEFTEEPADAWPGGATARDSAFGELTRLASAGSYVEAADGARSLASEPYAEAWSDSLNGFAQLVEEESSYQRARRLSGSDLEGNLDAYAQLARLYPDSPRAGLYAEKRDTYTRRISDRAAARRRALYAPSRPARRSGACCKRCTTGKPCGNSCISRSYTCRQPPGCAC